jgi:hypothetical protein
MKAAGRAIALFGINTVVETNALANIVTNPTFETFIGVFGDDGSAQLTGASTSLTGRSIVGGEIGVLKRRTSTISALRTAPIFLISPVAEHLHPH